MVQCPIATTPPAAAHQGQLLVKPITANALDSATTNESVFTGAAPADGTARGTLWFSVPANVATSEVAPTVGPFIAVRCTNAGLAYAATGLIVIGLDFIG
jgi:hypothetical protein